MKLRVRVTILQRNYRLRALMLAAAWERFRWQAIPSRPAVPGLAEESNPFDEPLELGGYEDDPLLPKAKRRG